MSHPPRRRGEKNPSVRACALLLLLSCGTTSSPVPLDQTVTSQHYLFKFAKGDSVDVAWQETYHAWLLNELPGTPAQQVEYRKYRDREHLQWLTGRATNGFAELDELCMHTIWPTDNHEVVHVLVIHGWGHPPALFNEGIAVAHSTDPATGDFTPRWNRTSVHLLARRTAFTLDDLLTSADFFSQDEDLTYPTAGSFVRWLLDTRGVSPMRAFFGQSTFDATADDTRAKFAAAYGFSLDSAWDEWRRWL